MRRKSLAAGIADTLVQVPDSQQAVLDRSLFVQAADRKRQVGLDETRSLAAAVLWTGQPASCVTLDAATLTWLSVGSWLLIIRRLTSRRLAVRLLWLSVRHA